MRTLFQGASNLPQFDKSEVRLHLVTLFYCRLPCAVCLIAHAQCASLRMRSVPHCTCAVRLIAHAQCDLSPTQYDILCRVLGYLKESFV